MRTMKTVCNGCGDRREDLYEDDTDRRSFLEVFSSVVKQTRSGAGIMFDSFANASGNTHPRLHQIDRDRLPGANSDEHFTGSLKLAVAFEPAQRFLDFIPCVILLGIGQAGQHLVQRSERFLLELQAFRCG